MRVKDSSFYITWFLKWLKWNLKLKNPPVCYSYRIRTEFSIFFQGIRAKCWFNRTLSMCFLPAPMATMRSLWWPRRPSSTRAWCSGSPQPFINPLARSTSNFFPTTCKRASSSWEVGRMTGLRFAWCCISHFRVCLALLRSLFMWRSFSLVRSNVQIRRSQ